MLIGNARPEVLKPAPVTCALEIVTLAFPPFCNVMVWELLEPIGTPENPALIGVADSCGVFDGGGIGVPGWLGLPVVDPVTKPAQPLPITDVASTIAARHFFTFCKSDPDFPIVRQV
jgi:hypothetical protein